MAKSSKQAIVVGTWRGGKDFANLCLKSLEPIYDRYAIWVIVNDGFKADPEWIKSLRERYSVILWPTDGYELSAFEGIKKLTKVEEFWFLQDSIEILDTSFIIDSFKVKDSISYDGKAFYAFYLGKYQRPVLERIRCDLEISSKQSAIDWEWCWTRMYLCYNDKEVPIIDPEFSLYNSNNYIETIFGEERFVVKGKYLIKRLGLQSKENIENLLEKKNPTKEEIRAWKGKWKHV